MDNQRNPPQGTLGMPIRNATSRGPLHGYHGYRISQVITGILRTTSEGV